MPDRLRYALHTTPGLESVTLEELRYNLVPMELVTMQPGLLVIDTDAPARALLGMRTVEDVFVVVLYSDDLPPTYQALAQLKAGLTSAKDVDRALAEFHDLHARRVKRVTFRVVTQMAGYHHFRRVDAGEAATNAIAARYPRWKAVADDAHIEFWLDIRDKLVITMLRLSDRTMRHRTYKRAHIPASLRPTVAAAMAFLSVPEKGDVFVDAMCGAGTILGERARLGPAALIVGGDLDVEAVEAAATNLGAEERIALFRWDATHLPLPDHSVDKIVTNLPFGKQLGTPEANEILYADFLQELTRVLKPRGRAVLLSSERSLMGMLLGKSTLRGRRQVHIRVLGQQATIYVLEPVRGQGGQAAP
jgi:tRNA (guanine6-N2)-methyltransferase